MDLTPSFGHQELMETLSQASSGNNSLSSESRRRARAAAAGGGFTVGSIGGRSNNSQKSSGRGASSSSSSSDKRQMVQHGSTSKQQYSNQGSISSPKGGGRGYSSINRDVDDAVRRLGYRLSLQAHGDGPDNYRTINQHQQRKSFQISSSTSFDPYDHQSTEKLPTMAEDTSETDTAGRDQRRSQNEDCDETDNNATGDREDPLSKVAKTRYTDHGDHHRKTDIGAPSRNIIRKLTFEAKDRFQKWEHEQRQKLLLSSKPAASSKGLSPQQYALAQLGLLPAQEGMVGNDQSSLPPWSQQQLTNDTPDNNLYHYRNDSMHSFEGQPNGDYWVNDTGGVQRRQGSNNNLNAMGTAQITSTKGLLSAVLEGHSDSSTTMSGQRTGAGDQSIQTTPSISTKASSIALSHQTNNLNNYMAGGGAASTTSSRNRYHGQPQTLPEEETPPLRGRCLTTPSESVANNGLDNCEGNLILYENDVLLVSKKNVRTVNKTIPIDADVQLYQYRVQALQGQGTFAQVFQCLHVQTGKLVAVKVIKNKPAYTRQAAIEIDIFQTLQEEETTTATTTSSGDSTRSKPKRDYMVNLICYFMYHNHLCLVFELLGLNLYEVLKQRQFRGLPLAKVREITQQAVEGIRDLAYKNVVHCDLKPENILLISEEANNDVLNSGERGDKLSEQGASINSQANDTQTTSSSTETEAAGCLSKPVATNKQQSNRKIKLIDFGSACFEGYTAHTYIQSRFYRSPEVLIGVPYDSAIDMWSLGCVAAELFLGLPILPGVHEHDQVGRILEMISPIPNWMLDQGSKSTKYYVKYTPQHNMITDQHGSPAPIDSGTSTSVSTMSTGPSPAPPRPQWRIKTQQEYINSLSQSEIRKKGGLARLQRQLGNRYFKRTKLRDILILHAKTSTGEDKDLLPAFVHFLYGILDPDPWKRLTAYQASLHPFITGNLSQLQPNKPALIMNAAEENQANLELNVYWQPPFDPAICRRKLLNVQKLREKQAQRRQSGRPNSAGSSMVDSFSDRRRSIVGDQSSLTGHQSSLTGLQSDLSMNEGSRLDGSSPPNQVSTPGSASVSQMSHQLQGSHIVRDSVGNPGSTYTGGTIPSWTDLSRQQSSLGSMLLSGNASVPGHASNNNIPNEMILSGARSLTGAGHFGSTPTEGDFGLALQRPGVIPDGFSISSQSTGTSMHRHQHPIIHNLQYGSQSAVSSSYTDGQTTYMGMSSHPVSLSSYGHGNQTNSQNTNSIESLGGSSMQSSMVSSSISGTQYAPHSNQYLPTTSPSISSQGGSGFGGVMQPSQSNRINTLPDVSNNFDAQQQLLLLQQQQQLILQQQQQLQQQQLQLPQQQFGMGQQQFGVGTQQQQGQLGLAQQQGHFGLGQPQQQQPVFLTSAAGGGYYYVTTSANGQPILLQAVGLLNQPMNQMGQAGYNHQLPHQQQQPPAFGGQHALPTAQAYMQQQDMYNPSGYGNSSHFPQDNYNLVGMSQNPSYPHQQQQQQHHQYPSRSSNNKGNRFRGGTSM